MPRGKVDQTRVGVLDLDAELVEALEELEHRLRGLHRLGLQVAHPRGVEPTSVPEDARPDDAEPLLEPHRLPPCRDEALDERPDLREHRVRLLGREVPHGLDTP